MKIAPALDAVCVTDEDRLRVDEIAGIIRRSLAECDSTRRVSGNFDLDMPLLEGGLGLDSVMLIELITRLETRLGFEFPESDLRRRSFRSVRSLAEVIATHLARARNTT